MRKLFALAPPMGGAGAGVLLILAVFVACPACDGQFRFDPKPALVVEAGPPGVTCAADGDCRLSSLRCDPGSATCVACLQNADCTSPGKLYCSHHQCVACDGPDQCGLGRICDTESQTCLTRCHDDSNGCPKDAPTCDLTRGVCVLCTDDSQCSGATPLCDVGTGQCVACLYDGQCPAASPRCASSGSCVACRGSSDCPTGHVCDPGGHVCV
jgi:hypothetical protein